MAELPPCYRGSDGFGCSSVYCSGACVLNNLEEATPAEVEYLADEYVKKCNLPQVLQDAKIRALARASKERTTI